jgi:hypothetical protein
VLWLVLVLVLELYCFEHCFVNPSGLERKLWCDVFVGSPVMSRTML